MMEFWIQNLQIYKKRMLTRFYLYELNENLNYKLLLLLLSSFESVNHYCYIIKESKRGILNLKKNVCQFFRQ